MTDRERDALKVAAQWVMTRFPERTGQPEVEQTRAMYARWLAHQMRNAAEEG